MVAWRETLFVCLFIFCFQTRDVRLESSVNPLYADGNLRKLWEQSFDQLSTYPKCSEVVNKLKCSKVRLNVEHSREIVLKILRKWSFLKWHSWKDSLSCLINTVMFTWIVQSDDKLWKYRWKVAEHKTGELQVTVFTMAVLADVKLIPQHFMREIKSFYCFVELNEIFCHKTTWKRLAILLGEKRPVKSRNKAFRTNEPFHLKQFISLSCTTTLS